MATRRGLWWCLTVVTTWTTGTVGVIGAVRKNGAGMKNGVVMMPIVIMGRASAGRGVAAAGNRQWDRPYFAGSRIGERA